MQYIVCIVGTAPIRGLGNSELEMNRKYHVKSYHETLESARVVATAKAKETPGEQYAIYVPTEIFEALPPAAPKMVHKKFNENGEVVIAL